MESRINIKILLLMLTLLLFKGCSCYNWWNMMSATTDESNTMIIEGRKEIRNRTLVLSPGTQVIFRGKEKPSIGGTVYEPGELIIGEGATLIAEGTPDEPIVFKVDEGDSDGFLRFAVNCNKDSIVQYCKFEKFTRVLLENDINISKCKFNYAYIEISQCNPVIQYNTFNGTDEGKGSIISTYSTEDNISAPIIRHNKIN